MEAVLCTNQQLVDCWYVVARVIDVQDAPVAVRLLDRAIVLWRNADGHVSAAPDRCPHREAPLSKGAIDDGCLVCAYHGWTFDGTGRCVVVPSAREGVPPPPRARLAALHVTERYGLVWVCLGQPAAAIPVIAEDDDPAFRRINTVVELWRTSCTRMTDNFLDVAHFPFVHAGTFGRRQDTRGPRVELEALDADWFGYRYEVLANNANLGTVTSGLDEAVVHRRMTTGFNLPFSVRSTIEYDTGLAHILLLASTPVDDVTSLFTFVVWRNDDFSVPSDEIVRFDLAIGAEDKRMLEQIDGVLPLDQTTLVSVQADTCGVEWRRRLVELMTRS